MFLIVYVASETHAFRHKVQVADDVPSGRRGRLVVMQ